jgi:3-oxoacyl-ACP reductase-like protein
MAVDAVHQPKERTMGIFGNIMSAIFGKSAEAKAAEPSAAPSAASAQPATTSAPAPAGSAPSATASSQAGSAAAPSARVDVAAVLSGLAAQNKQKLNWRTSIVDLMKLLDLDSSLAARKELAKELQYSGDMNDSAAMNIWLHKQVMIKLAENGGKVPQELRS